MEKVKVGKSQSFSQLNFRRNLIDVIMEEVDEETCSLIFTQLNVRRNLIDVIDGGSGRRKMLFNFHSAKFSREFNFEDEQNPKKNV